MSEKLSKVLKREVGPGGHNGSPEEPSLSKEISALVGEAHLLQPEQLRTMLVAIAERVHKLEQDSRTDELTGLLNRRGFHQDVQLLRTMFMREKHDTHIDIPMAFLMIDLDGFKEVNDKFGHAGGDLCLRLVAAEVPKVLRTSDIFARLGGDEFSIFLSHDDASGALKVAEKVRSAIEKILSNDEFIQKFPSAKDYKNNFSASIGIAPIDGKENLPIEDIQKRADFAAYVAKASGKRAEITFEDAKKLDADSDGEFKRNFDERKTLLR